MKYTEDGLLITLEELRKLLKKAENNAKYHDMGSILHISAEGLYHEPVIKQYSFYSDRLFKNFTFDVQREYNETVSETTDDNPQQEIDLLRKHIKMLAKRADRAETAADLKLLTAAICTSIAALQGLEER